jgi:hypothetical protein
MTDKMNESKLDTKLLQENQPKTITEKKPLFTNYSIERFSTDSLCKYLEIKKKQKLLLK